MARTAAGPGRARRPYGTWPSPVAASSVAEGSLRLGAVALHQGSIYWVEGRPLEGGRSVVVTRAPGGEIRDVTPPPAYVRSRVHEYGGGAYLVAGEEVIYSEYADQRLYAVDGAGSSRPLTPAGVCRYADGTLHPSGRYAVYVREDHTADAGEPVNTLVRVPLDADAPDAGTVVVGGHDFYATPRFSADGRRLCWLAWRHPQMPWDGTELWIGRVDELGRITHETCVAGGPRESIFQPGWLPGGQLIFVSDRTGWWNLYFADADGDDIGPLHPADADFGLPLWQFHLSTWAAAGTGLVCAFAADGRWQLARLHLERRELTPLAPSVEPGDCLAADERSVVCIARSRGEPESVVRVDLATGDCEVVRAALAATPPRTYVSVPEPISFSTSDDAVAYAWFYPPCNPEAAAPPSERPPLIVTSHGGPTTATTPDLKLSVQFWTSRGFAVVDVDYRGSTGHGRAYRDALKGRWGEVDVDDCIAAARHLVAEGRADGARLAIRGASAGGYTTLAALVFHPGVFVVGASYFGVSDLEVLARDTHKFEARYLDTLVGPYPEMRDRYVSRSPIHAVDRLACALILFQGLEDAVVPPSQSQMMADAVRAKGLPVAILTFAGEQHGFRRAETIVRCLEAELAFYAAVFGFTAADTLPPLQIDNLDWKTRTQT